MPTTKEQRAFLAAASELNDKHNAVRTDSETIPLRHSFWTKPEIDNAKELRSEWDVPPTLIPFYGDWHDLICLNIQNGSIEMLDDERRVLFTWPSHDKFVKNLESIEETPSGTTGIIESELISQNYPMQPSGEIGCFEVVGQPSPPADRYRSSN